MKKNGIYGMAHGHGGKAQAMTQHTDMESSTRHDTAHRAWSQAQAVTQHAIHGVKRKT